MLKKLLYILIITFVSFQLTAQNCPAYSNTAQGLPEACGEQMYTMTVENTGCNGQIFFNITGDLDFFGEFEIISTLTNTVVASGSTIWGSTINQSIGPLDPNVYGTVFDLIVDGGNITVSQNGNTIANTAGGSIMFSANITISSSTLVIHTPSGDVTKVVENCKDFIVQVPLSNTNYCNTLNVNLPWDITCDVTGVVIASGTHTVVVDPQVPTDPSDLVDISWNNTTCSWDVSPNFDCTLADIGSVFNISPDPNIAPNDLCVDGSQVFTVDYNGVSSGANCCSTAGPLTDITYDLTIDPNDIIASTSTFWSTSNHAGYINFPPNNSGGNATSLDLCLDVSNFCLNHTDNYYWVFIFVDGNTVYSQGFPTGGNMNVCLDLNDVVGFDQSSNVELYVFPNSLSTGTVNTLFTPQNNCSSLAPGNWNANITATINVVYEEQIGSPVSCTGELTPNYTSCGIDQPVIAVQTPATCNATSTYSVTNYDNTLTYSISPAGAIISGAGIISGNAGNYTIMVDNGSCTNTATFTIDPMLSNTTPTFDPIPDFCVNTTPPILPTTSTNGISGTWNPGTVSNSAGIATYTFTPDAGQCGTVVTIDITVSTPPPFTLSPTHPSTCGATDGSISIGGLTVNTTYMISYLDAFGNIVGPTSLTSDGAGIIEIDNLGNGSYSGFTVDLNGCVASNNSSVNLVAPGSPSVNGGQDVEVCEGELVTLTASNPDGAVIFWNNGVIDGQAFTPPVGTTIYTVSASISGCTSTDNVTVRVVPNPVINAGNDISVCEGQQVTLSATGAANYTWDNGVVNGQPFTPPSGTTVYTVIGRTVEGCEATDQVSVTVTTALDVSFTADNLKGCSPLTVNFTNTSASNGTCVYSFSNGLTLTGCNPTHTFTQAGCYDVTLTIENSLGCSSSHTETAMVCVDATPKANFVANPGVLGTLEDEVNFTNTSIGAETYEWSFGDDGYSYVTNPTHTYELDKDQYLVYLVAISEFGCTDTASTIIEVIEELIYYVPNTFTPDNDNINQVFKPIFTSGFDPKDYHLTIFNRWGERMFESYDSEYGWDGTYGVNSNKIVPEGVYIYKISFKNINNDERKEVVGHVNLLK